MHHLDDLELAVLQREARREAVRLHRRLPDHEFDLEDFVQDLLMELVRRFGRFERCRGDLGAFAGVVVRHHGIRLCRQHWRRRRSQGGAHLPLDHVDGEGFPLAELLPESAALWSDGAPDMLDGVERAAAVDCVMVTLNASQRRLCRALATQSVRSLVAAGWGSRSAIYRQILSLRPAFLARGVSPELLPGQRS